MSRIVSAYAAMETFYRPNREIAAIFAHRGIQLDFDALVASRLNSKLQRMVGIPRAVLTILSRLLPLVRMYSLFQHCMTRGIKAPVTAPATNHCYRQNKKEESAEQTAISP
jgi:hypothetical protein